MYFNLKSLHLRCLCYLISAKTAWQLVNRKADFFYKTNRFESIRITNRIDSNRELECSTVDKINKKLVAVATSSYQEGSKSTLQTDLLQHSTANPENLAKIGLVDVEIIGPNSSRQKPNKI